MGGSFVLDVPAGVTLTIAPGVVVKAQHGGSCAFNISCALSVEGTLNAVGTVDDPITFTSINDDTVGVATGTGDPQPGDWYGIWVAPDSSAVLNSVIIRYASTALYALSGEVAVRGRISDSLTGIRTCNWESANCAVDATHVDWGGPDGPFADPDNPQVCGAVFVDPWVGQDEGQDAYMFGSQNCDGSEPPDHEAQQASESYFAALGPYQIDCGNGFQDACDVIQQSQQCLSAAQQLAKDNFPVPVDASSTASYVGGEFVDKGSAYLRSSSDYTVSGIGAVTGFLGEALGVVSTIASLASAYNQCAP